VVSFGTVLAYAQPGQLAIWKGELHSDSRRSFEDFTVQLTDSRNHNSVAADVRMDGSFEFRSVTNGQYQLTVSRGDGQLLYSNFVSVPGSGGDMDVRLPEEKTEKPPSGGVSVSQLLHPPGPKAVACAAAAQKLSQAGEYAKAAAQLENAVRISPEYAEARINLGAAYLRLGRNQEAVDQLEQALRIAPPSPLALSNLALAQHMISRNDEAIRNARESLRLDSGYLPAHYVLGMVLARTGQSIPEAIAHLEKAAESFPSARANLDRLRAQLAAR
jgi:tetratricopeptide (TPR) repeat protein